MHKDPYHVEIPEIDIRQRRMLFSMSPHSVMICLLGGLLVSLFYVFQDFQQKRHVLSVYIPERIDAVADATKMIEINRQNLEKSLNQLEEAVTKRDALNQIEARVLTGKVMTDEQAKRLLLRAGYKPSEINDQKIEQAKQQYAAQKEINSLQGKSATDDVNFARDVASQYVRDEVESFAHKMKLLSDVGAYIFNRVND